MMQFDYLHESQPEHIERLRTWKAPVELHAPLCALLTIVFVIVCAGGIETLRLRAAHEAEAHALLRAQTARSQLAAANLLRVRVDAMLQLDRRLREIRLSGADASRQLADIADHVPPHAWLTSLSQQKGIVDLNGKVANFTTLSQALADLMKSGEVHAPTLVRAATDDRAPDRSALSFEVRAQDADETR